MNLNLKVTRGALIVSLLFGAWTLAGAQDQSGQSTASARNLTLAYFESSVFGVQFL